jgi:hypothetical protein
VTPLLEFVLLWSKTSFLFFDFCHHPKGFGFQSARFSASAREDQPFISTAGQRSPVSFSCQARHQVLKFPHRRRSHRLRFLSRDRISVAQLAGPALRSYFSCVIRFPGQRFSFGRAVFPPNLLAQRLLPHGLFCLPACFVYRGHSSPRRSPRAWYRLPPECLLASPMPD